MVDDGVFDEDGDIACDSECDGVAWSCVDFDCLSCAVGEAEECVEGSVDDFVDDD